MITKVLIISPEASPFAATGRLGRWTRMTAAALARAGYKVKVLIPHYGRFQVPDLKTRGEVRVPMGGTTESATLSSVDIAKVHFYFLQNSIYFDRSTDPKGLYVNPRTGKDYEDNAERFAFFARAAVEAIKTMGWIPDVILCNEWQSALIPMYLKTPYLYGRDRNLRNIPTVLTIHSLAYQGIFHRLHELARQAGFGSELTYPMSPLEFWGEANLLKAGMVYGDLLVLPQDEQNAYGLTGTLAEQRPKLHGLPPLLKWKEVAGFYRKLYEKARGERDKVLHDLDQEWPAHNPDRAFSGSIEYYPRGYSKKYGDRVLGVPEHTFSLSAGSRAEIVSLTYEGLSLHGPYVNASGLVLGIVGYVPNSGKEFGALLRSTTWAGLLEQLDWLGREVQERRVVVTNVDGQGHIDAAICENQGEEVARRVREKTGFNAGSLGTPYCASDEWDVLLWPYRGEKLSWINIRGYNDPF